MGGGGGGGGGRRILSPRKCWALHGKCRSSRDNVLDFSDQKQGFRIDNLSKT